MKTRLLEMRLQHGITIKQAAEIAGCAPRTYRLYELDQHAIKMRPLIRLALYYHTSTDYLVFLTDSKTPHWDNVSETACFASANEPQRKY